MILSIVLFSTVLLTAVFQGQGILRRSPASGAEEPTDFILTSASSGWLFAVAEGVTVLKTVPRIEKAPNPPSLVTSQPRVQRLML